MTVWRITPAAYAGDLRKGRGGLYASGRWHEKGFPVIYASENPATALLELLVNTSMAKLAATAYRVFEITLPSDALIAVSVEELPANWRAHPHPDATRKRGSEWLVSRASLAMRVPSAVFPLQHNVLLNPSHARMEEVLFGAPLPLALDERLVRSA